ncbi:MAG: hypothetical protein ACOY4L_03845 [Pseudomonadota bacterium]
MDLQNLLYAAVQVVHNFGAAAVVGGTVFALWPRRQGEEVRRALAWLVLVAWSAQAASGLGFGLVSQYYYGRPPDIHGVAVVALGIKVVCAVLGFLLAAWYLASAAKWPEGRRLALWRGIGALGVIALTAAAFLRWFS